jgi:hypothetical protein
MLNLILNSLVPVFFGIGLGLESISERSTAAHLNLATPQDRMAAVRHARPLRQGIEKRLCRFQIGGVEPFRKAVVDGLK